MDSFKYIHYMRSVQVANKKFNSGADYRGSGGKMERNNLHNPKTLVKACKKQPRKEPWNNSLEYISIEQALYNL